ncbi:MAG: META domain-containing protein [Hydrogenophilaceae bacterium]|jgi:heat shock protein HslJ|nr:META domain-containing protein [Hydrogenophilaceae bacterium]
MHRSLALAAAALAAACATSAPLDMEAPSGAWRLAAIDGAPPSGEAPTIAFEGDRVAGFAGCNRYFAAIEQDPNVARYFTGIGATRMACPEPAMSLETRFLARLGETMSVRVVDGVLVFFGDEEVELMRFAPSAE